MSVLTRQELSDLREWREWTARATGLSDDTRRMAADRAAVFLRAEIDAGDAEHVTIDLTDSEVRFVLCERANTLLGRVQEDPKCLGAKDLILERIELVKALANDLS